MQTIKLKYEVTEEEKQFIIQYQQQYSSCLHFMYNRFQDGFEQKAIEHLTKNLNNIPLMNSWLIRCCLWDCKTMKDRSKLIFGGKKLFFERLKGKISSEEYKLKKLSPIFSIGEITNKGIKSNRLFHIEQDLSSITFKPNRNTRINLQFNYNLHGRRLADLKQLYKLQEEHKIKIHYKFDSEYIYLSFEEKDLWNKENNSKISNRILGIDLNPNYIGWSIVDWKSENEFEIIKSGVYSIKDLNDKEKIFKKLKLSSDSKERIYVNNKRKSEIIEIVKNLINKALYYKVETISIENLNIKSKDNKKGKRFNRQINNQWLRNDFINNLTKRCNIFNIHLQKVQANYSSFIGNFVFRTLNLPDPVLASIELGRRAYEFISQYITKIKEIKKDIIWMDPNLFDNWITKSLEEFSLKDSNLSLFEIYCLFKNSKIRYRVPITSCEGQVFSLKSRKSYISIINY